MNFAINKGADVVTMSVGLNSDNDFEDAMDNAVNNGIVLVAASGNSGSSSIDFPASYSNVIAVGASLENDSRWSNSNYGSNLDLVAPGVASIIWSTDRPGSIGYDSGDYYEFGGASASAPHVEAVAGLIKAVDGTLTPSEIKTILHNTADKVSGMGGQSFTNEYGHGRPNALKAVYQAQRLAVQDQMVNFKSLDAEASGSNNSRRSVYQLSSSTYHIVFQSGSEIVYYKKLPWMTSQPILISENQTSDIGKNQNPNITIDTNGNLHAVWERKLYGQNYWKVYYSKSTDSGNTWSAPVVVADPGTNPQIMAYDAYYDNEIMLTYYYLNRIRARRYNHSTGNWDKWSSTDAIPNTSSYTSDYSAIASSKYNYTNFNVVYTNEYDNHIYHNQYNYTTSWGQLKNLSNIVPASSTKIHHSPSVSGDPSYASGASPAVHVAWARTWGSSNIVYHRWTSDLLNWPNVYYSTYYELQTKPSISGVGSIGNYEAYLVWEIQNNAGLAKQHFDGTNWSAPVTITSNGKFPSLSTGGSQAKYIYTDEYGPFYDVNLSCETLSKSVQTDPNFNPSDFEYQRSISFMDSTGAFIEFVVHAISEESDNAFVRSMNLNDFHQDSVDLSPPKALNVFQLSEINKGAGNSISFKLKIRGNRVAELFNGGNVPQLLIGRRNLFDNKRDLSSIAESFNSDFNTYSVKIDPDNIESGSGLISFDRYDFKKGVFASLGHNLVASTNTSTQEELADFSESEIENYSLSAYPKPLNPSTNISFTISEQAHVKLRVFDLLGREVAALVNAVRGPGEYTVPFNAGNLASGFYIYQLEAGDVVISKKLTVIK